MFAVSIQALFGGVIVTEVLFSYPGLGAQLVNAVEGHDTTLVQGIALVIATFYILVNVIADVVVVALVPRLRTRDLSERLRFARTGSGAVGLVLLVIVLMLVLFGPFFAPHAPAESLGLPGHLARQRVSARDATSSGATCSRALLWGGRSVVGLALAATAACYAVGLLIGVTAGYNRRLEGPLMRGGRRRARLPAAPLLPDHRHRARPELSGC